MSRPKGQKLKEVTKDILLQVRVDKETMDKLKETAKIKETTKSEIVRRGIESEYQKAKE